MSLSTSAAYYDFGQLATLRGEAAKAPQQALSEVAGQFEALFTQMMLKSMRDAIPKGGLFGSNQMDLYQSMHDQQMSMQLSSQAGLGLAEVLVRQLQSGEDATPREPADNTPNSLAQYASRTPSVSQANIGTTVAATGPVMTTSASIPSEVSAWNPTSIEEFVSDVWDGAVGAARELGLDPKVLVAQSALETGWGKRVIQAIDGSSSFNLFGIKADARWNGTNATVETLEFRDGVTEKERASFRVYDSLASSFSDYVSFLKSNPRYQQALEKVADSREFLQGLQDAGYATDPNYAQKIINIMDNTSLSSALAALKK